MIIYLSLIIALIGAFVYALSQNARAAELGRTAFGCGLLAFLLELPPHLVSLLKG